MIWYEFDPSRAGADHFLTEFEKYKRHRDSCRLCHRGNPLCGPLCPEGLTLRNNAIDETSRGKQRP